METHSCNDLLEAAREGHDECIKKLIVAGADLNVTDELGRTPMHYAISGGHDACVKQLIEAGADVNAVNAYDHTPLHFAAWNGRDTLCKMLVAAGANPNVGNFDGQTPLHQAVCGGYVTACKTLIIEGGNPDVVNVAGETPLQVAVKYAVNYADIYGYDKKCVDVLVECILSKRALTDDEWDLVPPDSDIGYLLPAVMTRDGRDAAAKLVSRLSKKKQKALETATLGLSRFVSRDVAEQILVHCV